MGQLPISNPKKMVSSILPYPEKLLENCSGNTKGDKVPCRICKMNIGIKFMCCHVGYHIINDNLQSVCDICVQAECSIVTWSYSIASHYKSKHPDYPTDEFIISPEEVKLVLAKNCKF